VIANGQNTSLVVNCVCYQSHISSCVIMGFQLIMFFNTNLSAICLTNSHYVISLCQILIHLAIALAIDNDFIL
jgi:hypothetical protein